MQMGSQSRVTIDFTVAADGRPIDIRRVGASYTPNADDLARELAASGFAAGVPHRDCQVTYVATRTPIAMADVADLLSASIDSRPSREAIDRIKPANSDCLNPAPSSLLRGYPDFAKLKGSVGRLQWSMVKLDIDAAGKPTGIRTLTGTNDAALDQAGRDAVARSRFSGGKRTGCLSPYRKAAQPLPAPAAPEEQSFRPDGATCPVDLEWAVQPVLRYPDNYRKRGIEGWAIIAFDAAPWAATGNIRVLAAEPAADFGMAAVNIITSARLAPSNRAMSAASSGWVT